jgi:hypothetical protein
MADQTDAEKRIAELEDAYKRAMLELHLLRAAADVGLRPTAAHDAADRAAKAGEWRITGRKILLLEDGSPVINDDGDYVTPSVWIRSPQVKADAPHLFVPDTPAEQHQGTEVILPVATAPGGKAANPYLRGQENFTEQGRLERDDPARAAQLAAEADAAAGIRNPWRPEHWNMGEQGRLYMRDQRMAERMAEEAGSFVGASRPARRA